MRCCCIEDLQHRRDKPRAERKSWPSSDLNDIFPIIFLHVLRCAIWFHLYNLRNVRNTHGGVLLLVKLQAKSLQFTKSNTPP